MHFNGIELYAIINMNYKSSNLFNGIELNSIKPFSTTWINRYFTAYLHKVRVSY